MNPKREFFRLAPEKVVLALSLGGFTEVTPGETKVDPEEEDAIQRVKARRPRLRLDAIGIKAGDQLNFSRDKTRTAVVQGDGRVLLDGELLSLSAAALKVLQSMHYRTPTASGSEYWMYDDELLDDRRRRIEAEKLEENSAASRSD